MNPPESAGPDLKAASDQDRGRVSSDVPTGAYGSHDSHAYVTAVDPTKCEMREGHWYAFRMDGREFFARIHLDGTTGFMELTEIPDPWICETCGKHYMDGRHEWDLHGGMTHKFEPSGIKEPE